MIHTYIGIDPGKGGGCAIYRGIETVATIHLIPFRGLYDTLVELSKKMPWVEELPYCFALLEKAAAFSIPRKTKDGQVRLQGVTSSFSFGENYGIWQGWLSALQIPFETVSAAKWQAALGCKSGGDKRITKAKAQQLFPSLAKWITHSVADALLIAEYCRRTRCK